MGVLIAVDQGEHTASRSERPSEPTAVVERLVRVHGGAPVSAMEEERSRRSISISNDARCTIPLASSTLTLFQYSILHFNVSLSVWDIMIRGAHKVCAKTFGLLDTLPLVQIDC